MCLPLEMPSVEQITSGFFCCCCCYFNPWPHKTNGIKSFQFHIQCWDFLNHYWLIQMKIDLNPKFDKPQWGIIRRPYSYSKMTPQTATLMQHCPCLGVESSSQSHLNPISNHQRLVNLALVLCLRERFSVSTRYEIVPRFLIPVRKNSNSSFLPAIQSSEIKFLQHHTSHDMYLCLQHRWPWQTSAVVCALCYLR